MTLQSLSLSSRIAGSALVLVALGALTLLLFEEAHLRRVYFDQRQAGLHEALHTNEIRLTQTIDTLRRDVRFLADTPAVTGIIRASQNQGIDPRDGNSREQWQARLQQIVAAFLSARSEYHQLAYIGLADQGRELVRVVASDGQVQVTPADRLQSRAEQVFYAAALKCGPGQVNLSEISPYQQEGTGEAGDIPTMYATTPVFDESGRLFGLLIIGMDMRPLLASTTAGLSDDVSTLIGNRAGQYLLYPDGGWVYLYAASRDITERKEAKEVIRSLALHDQLTGLPNRRCFLERLQAALTSSVRRADYGAVLFIDMDRFKIINDTWGHEVGDLMLIDVANRLNAAIRASDTASRFGGDEFVVLLGELGEQQLEAINKAGMVAEKIRATLAETYQINEHRHQSSPSIGSGLRSIVASRHQWMPCCSKPMKRCTRPKKWAATGFSFSTRMRLQQRKNPSIGSELWAGSEL